MHLMVPHEKGRELLGRLPDGVAVSVWDNSGEPPAEVSTVEFFVPQFLDTSSGEDLFDRMPALKVVQTLSAGVDWLVGKTPDTVTVCDARGVHDLSTSEWIVTAMLASIRDFPRFARAQAAGTWDDRGTTGVLAGRRVLIVGYGSIGAAVERRLAGFEVEVTRVARSPRDGVHAVAELPDLVPDADVLVLILPSTPETKGLVDADLLGRLPDGALLVNAARGPIVDTDALVAELTAGRLTAALDVTDPEPLPEGHPLWTAPGLLLTPHVAGSTTAFMPLAYTLVREQVERYVAGEDLRNVVSEGY